MTTTENGANINKKNSLAEELKIIFSSSRAFWLVNLVNFGEGIAYFGILTLLTLYLGGSVGMGDKITGVSVSAFMGLVTFFMLVGGPVCDKIGVRKALTLALCLSITGRIVLSLACLPAQAGLHGAGQIMSWGALLTMALGQGILQPSLYAGAKEYANPKVSAIAFSFIYAIMNLGIVCENFISPFIRTGEPFIGGLHGLGWGIMGVYMTVMALSAAILLAHMALFNKKTEERYRVVSQTADDFKKLPLKERLKQLPFRDARFMVFIFLLLPAYTLFAHQHLTMPNYIFRVFPQEVAAKFEWIQGINPFIIVFGVPLIAILTRAQNIIKMLAIGTAITACTSFMLLSNQPSLAMLLGYVVVFSIGEAVWSSRFYEYVGQLAPAGQVGAYMGLANFPWFLAKFTTGWYSGAMLAHFVPQAGLKSPGTLWLIYGLFACISPIGLLLAKKWIESRKN
jgi:dipeptide/tripeptide permease